MTTHRTKEQRRSQIADAAITCFAKKGYYEASMDDIAKAAGLSKGSLYWHFPSKRDLFKTLLESWIAEVMEGLPEAVAACRTNAEKLTLIADSIKNTVAVRPDLARAQLEFGAQALRDDEFREWFRASYVQQREFFTGILEEGLRSGEFRAVPVHATARMIMAYFDGLFLHREVNDIGDDVDVLLDEAKSTLFALLLNDPRSDRSID
jgi:AcrR family transcriptional regulator